MAQFAARHTRALGVLLMALVLSGPAFVPAVAEANRGAPRGSGAERGALIVKLKPGTSDAQAAAMGLSVAAAEIGRLDEINARVLKVTGRDRKHVREQLAANPAVLSVEDDGEAQASLVPSDPLWGKQWYSRKVRGPLAWDVTLGAGAPVVAVLDTGVQAKHPDLVGRVLNGWNFVANNSKTADDGDHGTPVAGIIAGAGNNGVGIAGMCWKCRILPVKVLNASGSGSWSNIAAGIIWAANNGADVINLSLGGPSGSTVLRDAVAYAVSKGAVVVAAAGNAGTKSKFFPAAYPGVLSVAATTDGDKLYSFSNRGTWVRVAAPGCTWSSSIGSKWRSFCGTSAATPVVAGLAALVRSRAPGASKTKIENAILSTAVKFSSAIGGGRVDAAAAVRKLGPTVVADPTPAPSATPKPTAAPSATPKPTAAPTATPKPTATPAVPREGSARWDDRLYGREDTDSKWFAFGGDVEFKLLWTGQEKLRVAVDNAAGKRVFTFYDRGWGSDDYRRGEFQLQLPYGHYKVTVSGDAWRETSFRVDVSWEDD